MLNTYANLDTLLSGLLHPAADPLFCTSTRAEVPSGWHGHVPFAAWIVAHARPRLLVELGTHNGTSYAAFCDAVMGERLDTRCYAIDTWTGDEHAGFYDESVWQDFSRFHAHRYAGFSELLRMTFHSALQYFEDGSIDLLHIDGCHSYEEVANDFEKWRPKMSRRGVVLFHDTNVREHNFGVWKLWTELNRVWPGFEFLHGHGLGVLAVGEEAPAAVRALCDLRDPEQVSVLRSRFAAAGRRCIRENEALLVAKLAAEREAELQQAATRELTIRGECERLSEELMAARTCIGVLEAELQQAATRELTIRGECGRLSGELMEARTCIGVLEAELREARERAATAAIDKARSEERLAQAEGQREVAERLAAARADHAESRCAAMAASTSWKVTWPMRALGGRIPLGIRRAGAVGLKVGWWIITPTRLPARLHAARSVLSAPVRQPNMAELPARTALLPNRLELMHIPQPQRDRAVARRWQDVRTPEISIVILNWNRSDMTLLCLQYVWANTTGHHYEVIVVDNGSTHDDLTRLEEGAGGARVLALGLNRYFGEANNIGVEAARGRLVCLLNNDAFVQPGWLQPLVKTLEQAPRAGAVGPKFVYPDGRLQEAGALVSPDGVACQLGKFGDPADPHFNTQRDVDYVSAACVLMRRAEFLGVLGFDLCWDPAYYEDVDICLKLRLRGLRTIYCPQATIVHIENATSAGREAQALKLGDIIEINRGKFRQRWEKTLLGQSEGAPALLSVAAAPPLPEPSGKLPTVALFTPYNITPGGGERHLLSIAVALRETHNVTLVTPHPFSRIRLLTMGRELGLQLDRLRLATLDEVADRRFDISFILGNIVLPPIAGLGRHNVFLCQFPFPFECSGTEQLAANWMTYNLVLVYSEFVRGHVLRQSDVWHLPARPVEVLAPPTRLRSAQMERKRTQILHVGRFFTGGHCKRQDLLIEAFRELLADGTLKDVELHLAGATHPQAEHRAYYTALLQAAAELPVVFHPNCGPEELDDLYAISRVYWHATGLGSDVLSEPHKAEHFGISVVEAMSAGCVPIVFGAGGPAGIVEHGRTGWHFHEIAQLCELTRRTLADAEAATAMGLAAASASIAYSDDVFGVQVRKHLEQLSAV